VQVKGGLFKKKRKDTPAPWLAKTSTHADSRKKLLAAIEKDNSQFVTKSRAGRAKGSQRGRPAAQLDGTQAQPCLRSPGTGEQKRRGERTKGSQRAPPATARSSGEQKRRCERTDGSQRARFAVPRRYGRAKAAKYHPRNLTEQIAHDFKFFCGGGSSKAETPTLKGILKKKESGILKTRRKGIHWHTTTKTSDKSSGHKKRKRSSTQTECGALKKKSKRTAVRPLCSAVDSICVEKRRREKRRKPVSALNAADVWIRKPSLNGVQPTALFRQGVSIQGIPS